MRPVPASFKPTLRPPRHMRSHLHPMTALRLVDGLPKCVVCGVASPFVCTDCNSNVAYCGVEHCMQDAPRHSQECTRERRVKWETVDRIRDEMLQALVDRSLCISSSRRPRPSQAVSCARAEPPLVVSVRGLYAGAGDYFGRYVDVSLLAGVALPNGRPGRRPPIVPSLAGLLTWPAGVIPVGFGHDGRELQRPLEVWFSTACLRGTGVHVNRAIAVLVGTDASTWKGPALVLKCGDRSRTFYVDIEDDDLYDVCRFFTEFCYS